MIRALAWFLALLLLILSIRVVTLVHGRFPVEDQAAPAAEDCANRETPATQSDAAAVVKWPGRKTRLDRYVSKRVGHLVEVRSLDDPYEVGTPEARERFVNALLSSYANAVETHVDAGLGEWVRGIEIHYDGPGLATARRQAALNTLVQERYEKLLPTWQSGIDWWTTLTASLAGGGPSGDPYRGHWAMVPSHALLWGSEIKTSIAIGPEFFSRSTPSAEDKKRDMASVVGHEIVHVIVAAEGLRCGDETFTAAAAEKLAGLPREDYVQVAQLMEEACALNYQLATATNGYKNRTRASLEPYLARFPKLRELLVEYERAP